MYTWNRHLKTLFSAQPLLLKLFVLSLLCLALFSTNPATAQAHPLSATPGASDVGVNAGTMKIMHYHFGFPAWFHEVPLDWYWQAVKKVGWGDKELDELYHFCMEEENWNKPECRGLHNPSPGL